MDEPTVDTDGTVRWHNKKGQLHRTDGPAIEWLNGTKLWYYEGVYHRDGSLPAIEWADGSVEYFHHGVRYYPEIIQINGEEIVI